MRALIIGGTGTLGRALTKELLKDPVNRIVCLSRCELKQKQLKSDFGNHPHLVTVLGDVRDLDSLLGPADGVDAIFHVAALKHIDVLEENPEESIKTNILGTLNVAKAAEMKRVPYVAFSSTDKACEPVNVYGMCKAISERVLLERNRGRIIPRFSVFRWGNVFGSSGSAIHAFAKDIKEGRNPKLTDIHMTRFWIKIEDAARFLLDNYMSASISQPMIPPIKAAPVRDVMKAIAHHLGTGGEFDVMGMRRGEKVHEKLTPGMSSEFGPQFSTDELRRMVAEVLG